MNHILAVTLLLALAYQSFSGVKNADAFWRERPSRDTNTQVLVSFDEKAGTSLADDIATLAKPEGDIELPPGSVQPPVTSTLLGDAAQTPGGRYGNGIKLSGKGAVDVTPVVWSAIRRTGKAFTLDFSFKPDADAGRAVLLSDPALQVVRETDGTITIGSPDGPVLKSPIRAPAGIWTHVALAACSDPERRTEWFAVNGVTTHDARLASPYAAWSARLRFGADANLANGFKGVIDEVRISSVVRAFYSVEETPFRDAEARRPTALELPFFARRGPLNVALPFDGALTPETLAGTVVSGKVDAAAFAAGVRGQALDTALAAKGGLRVEWTNALPGEAGTIEFWIQPLEWDNLFIGDYTGKDIPYTALLRISGVGDAASLGLSELGFRLGRSAVEESKRARYVPMHPGAWTHVLCAWSRGSCQVYLNGQRPELNQVLFSGAPHKTVKKDGQNVPNPLNATGPFALTFLGGRSLVDELRVYPWAFNSLEAQNAYARWLPEPQRKLAALPAIRFEPWYDYNYRIWHVRCLCMPANEKEPATAHIMLRAGKDATAALCEGDIKLNANFSGDFESRLELPFGDYLIEATSRATDQTVVGTTNWPYSRKAPEWWLNELGKIKTVPPPWTPVKVEGDRIAVWGREISLAPGGLPGQIEAAGTNLFATPVRLHGEANGKPVEFQGEPVVFGTKADDLAGWTGRMTAGGIRADVKGSIEYDGMMTFAVTLDRTVSTSAVASAKADPSAAASSSPQGTAGPTHAEAPILDRLMVDIPFVPVRGSQLIVNGGGNNFRGAWDVRFVPAGTGSVWNSRTSKPSMQKAVARGSFCPVVWIGDDERGVCFFGENDKGWTPGTNAPAQEIRRENGAVVYRMNVISQPVTLDKPRTFTFIVQPTPTKPLPEGWRAYNRGGVNGHWAGLEGIDACISPTLTAPSNATTHLGMTFVMEPPSWEDAEYNGRVLRERAGKNNPRLFYINYSWPRMGPSMDEYRNGLWSCGRMLWTREVEDYMTWIIGQYIRRDIIDGLYIDDTSLGANAVPFGTGYAMDDGTMQPGFNSLGFRRFLKRVRVLFQQAGKTPMIIPHMTYCFEIPALSFADACVNGEDRDIYYPTDTHFCQVWGLDELRIQSSSAKWGFVAYWKNGVVVKNDVIGNENTMRWSYWQSRAMHALAIQADLWYLWANENRSTIESSLTAFGIGAPEVRFIPNWNRSGTLDVTDVRLFSRVSDTGATAAGNSNAVLVCAYARPDRALVMVSNLHPNDQAVTVTIQPESLFRGARALQFKDADTGLTPPGKAVASKEEMQKAGQDMVVDLTSPDGAPEKNVDDLLSGKSPEDKARERLAPKPNGNTLMVPVRAWDFRLIEIRPAK